MADPDLSSPIVGGEIAIPRRSASKQRDDSPPEPLDPAHGAAVREGLDQMRRGEWASEDEIAVIYRRAGL